MIGFQFDDEWIEVPAGTCHHHHESLLAYIRARGLTQVKQMCEEGGCGACSLLELTNNGTELVAVSACLIPLPQATGRVFVTSSALARTKSGREMVKSFADNFASQCGYCTPGIVAGVACASSKEQRNVELDGHICRCTGYRDGAETITMGAACSIESLIDVLRGPVCGANANASKVAKALECVGSRSMRMQGTLAGSLYLQRDNDAFCSDVSTILGMLNAEITLVNDAGQLTVMEFMASSPSQRSIMVSIKMTLCSEALISIGKITPRPTMSAGYVTYAFCTAPGDKSQYYYNARQGLTRLTGTRIGDDVTEMNKSLTSISNVQVKALLFKHYQYVLGREHNELNFDQVNFMLDDSSQRNIAKNQPQQHAASLASGDAGYPSDVPPKHGQLHLAFVKATELGNIVAINFDACKTDNEFVRGITSADIICAGLKNCIQPGEVSELDERMPEEALCSKLGFSLVNFSVLYINQPLAVIVAKSRLAAQRLSSLVTVTYDEWAADDDKREKPTPSLNEAIKRGDFYPTEDLMMRTITRGDTTVFDKEIDANMQLIQGQMDQPGQYHNYMETQFAAVTINDQNVEVDVGAQSLDKVQRAVAGCLHLPHSAVSVKCRRTGGGFGGKATRSLWAATVAAIAAKLTHKPCSMHLSMADCIQIIGGRSIYQIHYKALFDKTTAKCEALDMTIYCDTGCASNDACFNGLLWALHGDGPYSVPNYTYSLVNVRTARPAVTWLRAPGMLQAAFAIERIIDHGLRELGHCQLAGRQRNHATKGFVNLAGEVEKTTRINDLFTQLIESTKFRELESDVNTFNRSHNWTKKGIALQTMKYGHDVSFCGSSVLVSVLKFDGSVQVTVGGIDMGQGMHTRCAQIVSRNLGCELNQVRVKPTNTEVAPNSSPTGGTITTHTQMLLINKATASLKQRMIVAVNGDESWSWEKLWNACKELGEFDFQERAGGKFKGPGSSYHTYGASLAIVELDCLTGEHVIERMDLYYDAGEMINVGIEVGQIEGGLMMSLGWLKMEHLTWDENGAKEGGTWDYKVPMHKDLPKTLNITLNPDAPEFDDGPLTGKPMNYPMSSKQAGEAAMCLAFSYNCALQNAVESFNPAAGYFKLPATPINVAKVLDVKSAELQM